jgi:hypothetical protein
LDNKLYKTMLIFDEYEKRFAKARIDKPFRDLTDDTVRTTVLSEIKKILGYKEELIPQISDLTETYHEDFETYTVKQLRYQTYKNCYGSASLYMPKYGGIKPLIFIFCGHGGRGRLHPSYMFMGHRLAKMGFAVVIPDNLGQGDREGFGHKDTVAPFYCGISLQGMILMESEAVVRHFTNKPYVDLSRVGCCGNSGGGTLSLFMAALSPEMKAIAATGYPSEFSFIMQKEKQHCLCNMLPGIGNGPEMWEVLSLFAPKPLFLEQGYNDHYFPQDLFIRNARKVAAVYKAFSKRENFEYLTTKTKHSWENIDRYHISNFFAKHFGMNEAVIETDEDEALLLNAEKRVIKFPKNAITTDEVAQNITGINMPENTRFCDVFKPKFRGEYISEDDICTDLIETDIMQIFAQMESYFAER